MNTWLNATHIHVIKTYIPGSWGKNSMECAARIGLNKDDMPDGMAIIGFTKDKRMCIIFYKVPGGDLELTKRFVRRPGTYSVPDFLPTSTAIMRVKREAVYGWIEDITTASA